MLDRVGSPDLEAACRAKAMARLRRWAASGTVEGCISTWNSASGFSWSCSTYPLHTIAGGSVESPIGTPKNEAKKRLKGADSGQDWNKGGLVGWAYENGRAYPRAGEEVSS